MKSNVLEIYLHEENSRMWGIKAGDIWAVSCGKKQTRVRLREGSSPLSQELPVITITPGLARDLHLPSGISLTVSAEENKLRLGPLVGILAGPYNTQTGSFGSQDKFFRSLCFHMRKLSGLAFVFTCNDLDPVRKLVHGYYLEKEGGPWRRLWLPFPDVCYNRYHHHSGDTPSRYGVMSLKKYGIKVFNMGVGDKWSVHKRLLQNRQVAPHLPETHLVKSRQILNTMLAKYPQVYIKPINGCKGQDIIRISRHQGSYLVKSTDDVNGRVIAGLSGLLGGSVSRLRLVQQGIKTPGDDRHFDLRVMVQKDRYNEWHVSGIAVRMGARGRITTNMATRGQAERLEQTLGDLGWTDERIARIREDIKDLALEIAGTLDRYAIYLGELGLDFIIDTRGKVWFLEANPKPARKVFTIIDAEMRRLAVSRPMEYACWLAGF
ncbi:MAG: YheC/YheD family protein [Syntrophomonadaceae bacterium]|nr:YheC/YheD family protein [Syntrophomonadaceae bacterium]